MRSAECVCTLLFSILLVICVFISLLQWEKVAVID